MPPEAKKEFYQVVDRLGNVQIRRVTFAISDDGNGKRRSFGRLSGRFNPVWIPELLRKVSLDAKAHKDQDGVSILVVKNDPTRSGPAFAFIGDRDLLIAANDAQGENDHDAVVEQVLAVREKKEKAAPSAALKAPLAKIPAGAVGYFAGDLPEDIRRGAAQPFGSMPKSVIAYVQPAATGLDFVLKGAMEDEAQAKMFIQVASKLRMDAINSLDKAPALPIPGINPEDLKSMFNSMQLEAKGAEINVRMLISEEGMKTLPFFFVLRSAPQQAPLPPRKKGN